MTTTKIPQMWLAGRTLARELEGMDPHAALLQAVADWRQQERLAARYESELRIVDYMDRRTQEA